MSNSTLVAGGGANGTANKSLADLCAGKAISEFERLASQMSMQWLGDGRWGINLPFPGNIVATLDKSPGCFTLMASSDAGMRLTPISLQPIGKIDSQQFIDLGEAVLMLGNWIDGRSEPPAGGQAKRNWSREKSTSALASAEMRRFLAALRTEMEAARCSS